MGNQKLEKQVSLTDQIREEMLSAPVSFEIQLERNECAPPAVK